MTHFSWSLLPIKAHKKASRAAPPEARGCTELQATCLNTDANPGWLFLSLTIQALKFQPGGDFGAERSPFFRGVLVPVQARRRPWGCVLIRDKLRLRVMNDRVNTGFPCWEVTQLRERGRKQIRESRAARPPLQLFSVTRRAKKKKQRRRETGGRGSSEERRREETEVFTGYFGPACSEALMQKLQIRCLTKSPVAVMKQD